MRFLVSFQFPFVQLIAPQGTWIYFKQTPWFVAAVISVAVSVLSVWMPTMNGAEQSEEWKVKNSKSKLI